MMINYGAKHLATVMVGVSGISYDSSSLEALPTVVRFENGNFCVFEYFAACLYFKVT